MDAAVSQSVGYFTDTELVIFKQFLDPFDPFFDIKMLYRFRLKKRKKLADIVIVFSDLFTYIAGKRCFDPVIFKQADIFNHLVLDLIDQDLILILQKFKPVGSQPVANVIQGYVIRDGYMGESELNMVNLDPQFFEFIFNNVNTPGTDHVLYM